MSADTVRLFRKAKDFGYDAFLLLESGEIFFGKSAGGIRAVAVGELCFTTATSGYQHTITDPSFAGQIINFTSPHIGNVGINKLDDESSKIFCSGVVFRECVIEARHHLCNEDLFSWLKKNNIPAISGLDTRKLTKIIRRQAQNAVICTNDNADEAIDLLKNCKNMQNSELSCIVSGYALSPKSNDDKKSISLVDFGVKASIVKNLQEYFSVNIVPAKKNFHEEILNSESIAIALSNGPGDPSATFQRFEIEILALLSSNLPILAICLGYQLAAIGLGLKTHKMHVGHRGVNHPIYNLETKKVEITSQNHGFAVVEADFPSCIKITHRSLFDGTIECFVAKNNVFAYQNHPEGGPGPVDSRYVFKNFADVVNA